MFINRNEQWTKVSNAINGHTSKIERMIINRNEQKLVMQLIDTQAILI